MEGVDRQLWRGGLVELSSSKQLSLRCYAFDVFSPPAHWKLWSLTPRCVTTCGARASISCNVPQRSGSIQARIHGV